MEFLYNHDSDKIDVQQHKPLLGNGLPWILGRLLGWTSMQGQHKRKIEGAIHGAPCTHSSILRVVLGDGGTDEGSVGLQATVFISLSAESNSHSTHPSNIFALFRSSS